MNLNLCRTVAISSKMANGDQPISRGNDNFFCDPSGIVSNYSHGTTVVGVLGFTYSKPIWIIMGEL